MTDTVLHTKGLTKRYGAHTAVDRAELTVEKGQIYGLVGRNGAGKTTIIRMVTGQTVPTAGEISLFGATGKDLMKVRARTGVMVETPSFYPYLTARQNLEYYRIQRGIPGKGTVDQVYLAVRLAVYDLCLREHHVPLILDDALAAFDQERMERALDLLVELSNEEQILFFTCQSREGAYLAHTPGVERVALDS